jgi:hypothetical protein
VLGECVGKGLGELEARQVVAVCDHLRLRSVLNLNSEARTIRFSRARALRSWKQGASRASAACAC